MTENKILLYGFTLSEDEYGLYVYCDRCKVYHKHGSCGLTHGELNKSSHCLSNTKDRYDSYTIVFKPFQVYTEKEKFELFKNKKKLALILKHKKVINDHI